MDLEKFYQAIRNELRLTNYLAHQDGDAVNVGETFTVRFQLWNDASAAEGGPHGIRLRDQILQSVRSPGPATGPLEPVTGIGATRGAGLPFWCVAPARPAIGAAEIAAGHR